MSDETRRVSHVRVINKSLLALKNADNYSDSWRMEREWLSVHFAPLQLMSQTMFLSPLMLQTRYGCHN
jgi:hypothetical protein